ncbi:MAG: OmpH family outer membrane protein [Gammaproteobacteria bacterium]|nr:OmpH family outer membrane protein [Gammaproteobacteria bacterium]
MRKIVIKVLSIALLCCCTAVPVLAADLNIGVVNVARLLDEAPQARSAMKALQDEFAPRQREIQSQEQELRSRQEEIERDVAVMGETERRDAEKDLRERARDLARKQNEYLEDLNLRRNEELGRLQRALMEEVQTFARQKNYDLIVGDGVLFASGNVDVTAEVLAGLERSFQSSN